MGDLTGSTVAGKYRVVRRLGAGGMGAVYVARHLTMERDVALKVLRPELCDDAGAVARFVAEARAASRVESPHVIIPFDFGRDEPTGSFYLIMELLRGRSLAEELSQEGALPEREYLRITRDVARALVAAHDAGVVHRDLKPDNVFLAGPERLVKVLDFGIAKMQGSSLAVTQAGALVGTPIYISPEAASQQPVGPPADIYSLGVMVFEMISGQPPFRGDSLVAVLTQHVTEPPPRPSARASTAVDPRFDALVHQMLSKSPTQRPGARQVIAAVDAILEGRREPRLDIANLETLEATPDVLPGDVSIRRSVHEAPRRGGLGLHRLGGLALVASMLAAIGLGAWGLGAAGVGAGALDAGASAGPIRDVPDAARMPPTAMSATPSDGGAGVSLPDDAERDAGTRPAGHRRRRPRDRWERDWDQ